MDRLDLLMSKCSQDIAEIAASESEITSSSNRLLNELAFVRTSNLTKSDQETVKRNTEAMLNILMTYTNPNTLTNLSAPLSSAHPSQEDKDKNCKMPTSDDEDHQMVHNSVNDFVIFFIDGTMDLN